MTFLLTAAIADCLPGSRRPSCTTTDVTDLSVLPVGVDGPDGRHVRLNELLQAVLRAAGACAHEPETDTSLIYKPA